MFQPISRMAFVLAVLAGSVGGVPASAQVEDSDRTLTLPDGGDPCEDRLSTARATLDDSLSSIDSRQLNRLFSARDTAVEACASGNTDFAEGYVEEFVGLVELALLRQRARNRGDLTRDELIDALEHAGYREVTVIMDDRDEGGVLRLQATDIDARAVELEVDVRTGEVLRETLVTGPATSGG